MPSDSIRPRTRVVHSVVTLARLITLTIDRSLAEFDLSFAQYRVLWVLDAYGALSGAEISRYLTIRSPTVVGLVGALEGSGLVRRMQPAGRRVPFALTAKGRRSFAVAAERVHAIDDHLCELLPLRHVQALERSIDTLTTETKAVLSPPASLFGT